MFAITDLIRKASSNESRKEKAELRSVKLTKEALEELFGPLPMRGTVSFRLWTGEFWPEGGEASTTVIELNRPGALREMLLANSESSLGYSYLDGAFDIHGEMEPAFALGEYLVTQTLGWTQKLSVAHLLSQLPARPKDNLVGVAQLDGRIHSRQRDSKAIDFHYNVSNDFYALWLGRQMAYSCAYFEKPEDSLEKAQEQKFELICRKLGLKRDDRFLDVGCGCGGLVIHAAKTRGVRAVGITLSTEQLEWARLRVREAGLENRVSIELLDYRDLPEESAFDAIASVGMVEHVGRQNLPVYFNAMRKLLAPGGLFLNHGIGIGPLGCPGHSGSFIQHYVFPDSDLLRIGEMTTLAEREGWAVRDIENLRLHYSWTLREWVNRLKANRVAAQTMVGEQAYRRWELYMAGCAYNFRIGRLAIYQTLLANLDSDGACWGPAVRTGWYT